MKAFLLLLITAITTAVGCQQPSGNTSTNQADDSASAAPAVSTTHLQNGLQCFTQIVGKDTAYLHLQANNDSISGRLEYHRYEKDSNTGELKGMIRNNIIDAQYHFMSEGVMSTVPAVFKLQGEQLYEGLPTSFNNEGQPVFDKDPARIQFDTIPFIKTTCP